MREPHVFHGLAFTEGVHDIALRMSGEALELLHGPCVYAWFSDGECLYVGSSKNGFSRLFYNHHVVNVKQRVQPSDEFHVFFGEGKDFEQELIIEWKPKYNKHLKRTKTSQFIPDTPEKCTAALKLAHLRKIHHDLFT